MPRDSRSTDTGTLGKAMRVLEIVARAERPLRFSEVLAGSDQPRGTLHRQLSNLVEEGLLEQAGDHSYTLGLRLLQLASRAWAGNEFRRVAEPHLRQLHDQTGETVHLGVLRGVEVVYLDKVEGRQAVRMHSQVGNASPCYCTGVGKAALSLLPEEELERRIALIPFRRFTPSTITEAEAFRAEIRAIRASGISFDREEHEPGIRCVAAPIRSPDGTMAAGLSVTAPAYRVSPDRFEAWVPLVRQAAADIMTDMETRLGPRR